MNYEEESYKLDLAKKDEVTTTTMFTYSENVNFSGFWICADDGNYMLNEKGEIVSSNSGSFNLESGTFVRRIGLGEGEIDKTQNVKNDERIVYIGEKAIVDGATILYNKDTLEIIKCDNTAKDYVGKYYVEFDKSITETETETETETITKTIQLIVEIDEENNTGSIIYPNPNNSGYSVTKETTGINFNIIDNNNENKVVYVYISRDINEDEFTDENIQHTLLGAHLTSKVTTINNRAFGGCKALTKVYISYGVTKICEGAFGGCYGLKYMEIPISVTSIGNHAFNDCNALTHVNIPHGVKEISVNTFHGCDKLEEVVIPNTIETIDLTAFSNSDNINTIIITGCNNADKVNENIKAALSINDTTHNYRVSMGSNTITYTKFLTQ